MEEGFELGVGRALLRIRDAHDDKNKDGTVCHSTGPCSFSEGPNQKKFPFEKLAEEVWHLCHSTNSMQLQVFTRMRSAEGSSDSISSWVQQKAMPKYFE